MQISVLLAEQIAELFLMILMGYVIVKLGLVTDDDSKILSKIVLYIVIPCVMINAFQINYTPDKVQGMLIAGMNLRDIFTNRRVYAVTFLRLLLVPVLALIILKISGLVTWHPQGEKILLVIFLAVITPSASTITQMCQVYGGNSKYSSAINVMTTLLAIVTMPIMVLLYEKII